jgi:ribosomal protein S18 acetylase RimI-like enzyme
MNKQVAMGDLQTPLGAGPENWPFEIRPIDAAEIEAARQLLLLHGWDRGVASTEEFAALVARSQCVLVAVQAGQVIGFLRALTDGMTNGYISMLAVAPAHQGQGVGRALVQAAMGQDRRMTWVLRAAGEAAGFYEKLGFARSTVAMERPGRPT